LQQIFQGPSHRAGGGIDTSGLPWTSPIGQRFMPSLTMRHRQWWMFWWPTTSADFGSRGNCSDKWQNFNSRLPWEILWHVGIQKTVF
jgi:hypothetical protein